MQKLWNVKNCGIPLASLRDTMSQMNMVTIYLPNKWFYYPRKTCLFGSGIPQFLHMLASDSIIKNCGMSKTAESPSSLRDTMSQTSMVNIYLPNKWFIIHITCRYEPPLPLLGVVGAKLEEIFSYDFRLIMSK